jgi:hypothetical protein
MRNIKQMEHKALSREILHAGESWCIPPDLRAISEAAPGTYRLRDTGERIEDPDLLTTWTIQEPPPKH